MSRPTLAEQIAVDKVSNDTFISRMHPDRMGNGLPIAYGGCTASLAVHSACKTVPSHFHAYNIIGAFHGPTRTDRKVLCRVTRTRDTKTFASRRVIALQTTDNGTERPCMEIVVEFQVVEPALYDFSAPPTQPYIEHGPLHPQHTTTFPILRDQLIAAGHLTHEYAAAAENMFKLAMYFFETRLCTNGLGGQNLNGWAKQFKTDQENLSMPEKFSAEWYRANEVFNQSESQRGSANEKGEYTESAHIAALTFAMDGGLSFLPLISDHKQFEDAGACSTLDFALRIIRPVGLDVTKWHLKERKMIGAALGRSYTENRLWDEQGNLVAVETQTCIVRPLPQKEKEQDQRKKQAKI